MIERAIPAPIGGDSSRPQIILAFDFGARRIGVASADTLTRSARPVKALDGQAHLYWPAIDALVYEYTPAQFVVGLPLNMDGTPTLLTDACRAFARALEQRYTRPCVLVDERLSSREAEGRLRQARASGLKRSKTSREDIDMAAACVLLEQWLQGRDAAGRDLD